MSIELKLHLDRSSSHQLSSDLLSELKRNNSLSENNPFRVSFCGIVMIKDEINIFLPRSSNIVGLSYPEQISIAAVSIKAVEKYGRDKKHELIKDQPDNDVGLGSLTIIKQLLDDYIRNGIYARRRNIRTVNSGRPNWKATISTSLPFPTKNKTPVYLDIHCNKRGYFSDTEVSAIHASVIKKLDRDYSWLITGREGLIAPQLLDFPEPISKIEFQVQLLKRELHRLYSDREMFLLKNLIRYLELISGKGNSNFIAGLRNFEFAWEHMLREVMEQKVELNSALPIPVYEDINGFENLANEKAMRTDIVIEDQALNAIAVIDAKYYSAESHVSAPGWSDLVKQFFYAKALKILRPNFYIGNYFIFPGEFGHLASVRVRNRKTAIFYDRDFAPIKCRYVCPLKVLDHYVVGKKISGLSRKLLTDSISH